MTDALDDEQRRKRGQCLFRGFPHPHPAPALPSQALCFLLSFFVIAPCVLKLSPTPSPSLSPPSFCDDSIIYFSECQKKKKKKKLFQPSSPLVGNLKKRPLMMGSDRRSSMAILWQAVVASSFAS